jgi:hypothetical protein
MSFWDGLGDLASDFFLNDDGDGINWQNIATLGAGIYGYNQAGSNQQAPVGYQGGIPDYTATRYQLPVDPNAPATRPGAGGKRYFTDTTYTKGANPMGYVPPAPPTPIPVNQTPTPTTPTPTTPTPATPTPATPVPGYVPSNPNAGPNWNPSDPSTWSADELTYAQGIKPRHEGKTLSDQQGTGTEWYHNQKGPVDLGDDYLTDIANLMTEMKDNGPGPDGTGADISTGELSTLIQLAQQYGVSPEKMAQMAGTTTADAVARIREQFPHLAHNYLTQYGYAKGGIASMAPRYLAGPTDGMGDRVPTNGSRQSPPLSDGEFVVPADVVSHLGNGNSQAGAQQLYSMMDRIRMARTGTPEQGKPIDPTKFTPR